MNRDVTVREVMDREFVGASESDGMVQTVEVMLRSDSESVVVLRGSEPVGVMSTWDVLASVVEGGDHESKTVGDVMTESVPTVAPDRTLSEARDQMSARSTSRLVVTDGAEPLGVVTEHDILTASRLGSEAELATDDRQQAAAPMAGPAGSDTTSDASSGGFSEQSICEVCGSFSRDLTSINGQLLCADCRDV
ncbi:MAG: CBS domain-containing protein [Haloarculaceae archaeon]